MKTSISSVLITVSLVCLGLSPRAQAVVPPPDGGYPGGNTAEGQDALLHLTAGVHNTAVGFLSLKSDTTGSYNTAIGSGTLRANRSDANTATGTFALLNNTGGWKNTANGALALLSNTSGNVNTAVGYSALVSNTVGFQNTAVGDSTLGNNTTGNNNTASGSAALSNNTTGDGNTATGFWALYNNGTGGGNTAVGHSALSVNQSGIINIALGFHAGDLTTGDNNIVIGSRGVQGESNTIRIGGGVFGYGPQTAAFIAGISGTAVVGDPVVVDGNGQLGVAPAGSPFSANQLLEQQRVVQELKTIVVQQQKQIDALTAGLQKVSAQLEANKPAPQMVSNP